MASGQLDHGQGWDLLFRLDRQIRFLFKGQELVQELAALERAREFFDGARFWREGPELLEGFEFDEAACLAHYENRTGTGTFRALYDRWLRLIGSLPPSSVREWVRSLLLGYALNHPTPDIEGLRVDLEELGKDRRLFTGLGGAYLCDPTTVSVPEASPTARLVAALDAAETVLGCGFTESRRRGAQQGHSFLHERFFLDVFFPHMARALPDFYESVFWQPPLPPKLRLDGLDVLPGPALADEFSAHLRGRAKHRFAPCSSGICRTMENMILVGPEPHLWVRTDRNGGATMAGRGLDDSIPHYRHFLLYESLRQQVLAAEGLYCPVRILFGSQACSERPLFHEFLRGIYENGGCRSGFEWRPECLK
jgi:hypothetical protein